MGTPSWQHGEEGVRTMLGGHGSDGGYQGKSAGGRGALTHKTFVGVSLILGPAEPHEGRWEL